MLIKSYLISSSATLLIPSFSVSTGDINGFDYRTIVGDGDSNVNSEL